MFNWDDQIRATRLIGQTEPVRQTFAIMGLIAVVLLAIFLVALLFLIIGRVRRHRRLSRQNQRRSGETDNKEPMDPWSEAGQRAVPIEDTYRFHRRKTSNDNGYDPDKDDERDDL